MPATRPRPAALIARAHVLALALVLVSVACGGSPGAPAGIEDPGAVPLGEDVPDWFPPEVRPPAGSVVIDVIDDPAPGLGRTVTWRAEGSFAQVSDHVERLLEGLGWSTTVDPETVEDAGARRRTYFVENDSVFSIQLFEDDNLDGVRLSAELPAAG